MVITKHLGLLFIVGCIIIISSIQDVNADIFADMADLVKKGGTSIVCITIGLTITEVEGDKGVYPPGICQGL